MTDTNDNLTYKDVLKAKETLNDSGTVFAQWTNLYTMTPAERKKAVREVLLQPYMEDVYKAHHIEAKDVKEFIKVIQADRTASENVIFNNSNAFQQNKDNSKDMNGDGKGDGDNTKIDSYEEKDARKNQLIKAFEKLMKPFAMQKAIERMPNEQAKTKLQKTLRKAGKLVTAFLEVGRVVVIATGITAATFVAKEILKNNANKKTDKDNVTSKVNVKENNKDGKLYMDWAKKNQSERS